MFHVAGKKPLIRRYRLRSGDGVDFKTLHQVDLLGDERGLFGVQIKHVSDEVDLIGTCLPNAIQQLLFLT